MTEVIVCADVGSTYTKVSAVDARTGQWHGSASHRTTTDSDVLDGIALAREELNAKLPPDTTVAQQRVCSSAGGGLRLGVIGNEPLVTATAAHRAGLSAGARVVGVLAGDIGQSDWEELAAADPDILLLAGGTDGGDSSVLSAHAAALAAAAGQYARLRKPVVMAGNRAAADDVAATLHAANLPVTTVANVLPRIGQLEPGPARVALREAFLRHVIAGKHLSHHRDFTDLVRSATPDTVLSGVELLADGYDEIPARGDLVVVDVGGATTDVYSVLTPDAELEGPRREVAGTAWRSRTVEGDLGVRHTATGIVAAAVREDLIDSAQADTLGVAAERRVAAPWWVPDSDDEIETDLILTRLAISVALRRHARGERLGGPQSPLRGGKDLRAVALVVGSGGVLRHHGAAAHEVLDAAVLADTASGYPLPEAPGMVIDTSYVLAAAGLLTPDRAHLGVALLNSQLGFRH